MEVSNEYLVGSWIVSSSIINSLSIVGRMVRIYLVLANEKTELVDLSNFETTPKKLAHKSIHIHKLAIVACPKSHII
jgi:hypothetical protein